jgi:hypothetical protein
MDFLERIEQQIEATGLPLFAVTLAAVPCPDTPLILTLHWHGFIREKRVEDAAAETIAYAPVPSSALQVNDRWDSLMIVELAAVEAAWELGAWDVARAERPSCGRLGAAPREGLECMQAFGGFPYGVRGQSPVVAEAPDADELLQLAARRGYLMWLFRPVRGGIWGEVANDATLRPDGTRTPPCPVMPVPPVCDGRRETRYRLGQPAAS